MKSVCNLQIDLCKKKYHTRIEARASAGFQAPEKPELGAAATLGDHQWWHQRMKLNRAIERSYIA
ncbi:MAG: hypothetical protein EKK48_12680 [Candidatus Melainabacteria bacterium]|nr:MAG: hypothetical protein EKK48_12680 [Candidatus Melainabacteria bacterium]